MIIRKLKPIAAFSVTASSLIGCIHIDTNITGTQRSTPTYAVTSVSSVLDCQNNMLQAYRKSHKDRVPTTALIITNIPDETVLPRAISGNKLSSAGTRFFKKAISGHFYSNLITTPQVLPQTIKMFGDTGIPLNSKAYRVLLSRLKAERAIVLTGSYGIYDQAQVGAGFGGSGSWRDDNGSFETSHGKKAESGLLGITVGLGYPTRNQQFSGFTLNLPIQKHGKSTEIGFGYKGAGLGFSWKSASQEGPHSGQVTLADAAVAISISAAFPKVPLSLCWTNPQSDPALFSTRMAEWRAKNSKERYKDIQRVLKKNGFYKYAIDGKFQDLSWKAVKAYEKKHFLIPHSSRNIEYLFAFMLSRGEVPDDI